MSGETGRDLLETRDMRNLEDLFRRCCGRSGVEACCWSEGVAMMLPDMLMLVCWREFSYTSQCMLLIGLARVVFNKRSGCSGTCVARVETTPASRLPWATRAGWQMHRFAVQGACQHIQPSSVTHILLHSSQSHGRCLNEMLQQYCRLVIAWHSTTKSIPDHAPCLEIRRLLLNDGNLAPCDQQRRHLAISTIRIAGQGRAHTQGRSMSLSLPTIICIK